MTGATGSVSTVGDALIMIAGFAAVLEKQRRFFVMVKGDKIVVTSDMGFRAEYLKRPYHT